MFARAHVLSAFAAASTEVSTPSALSTGEALLAQGDMVRRRARQGHRNSPLLHNGQLHYGRALTENLLAIWLAADDATRNAATAAWNDWADDCGYLHQHGTLYQVLAKAAHHLAVDGECFVQRIMVDAADHPNGLLLQVWPGNLRARVTHLTDGMQEGVEYENGRVAAVWFKAPTSGPHGGLFGTFSDNNEFSRRGFVRIPFADLIWLRHAPAADQIDGLPPTHASIESDAQLAKLAETALFQQQAATCIVAAILAEQPTVWTKNVELGPQVTDSDGNELEELEPGLFPIIHGARDIKPITSEVPPFPMSSQKARVAAGMGLTSELVSAEAADASFSALKFADRVQQSSTNAFRNSVGWDRGKRRLVAWWRAAESLMGRDHSAASIAWLTEQRVALDPKKSVEAEIMEIETGIKSKTQAIRERGRDPREVRQEIQEENNGTDAAQPSNAARTLRAC